MLGSLGVADVMIRVIWNFRIWLKMCVRARLIYAYESEICYLTVYLRKKSSKKC